MTFELAFCLEIRAYRSSSLLFGRASGPIFLQNLACAGVESTVLDCPQSVLGLHECDHSQDAGVQCFGMHFIADRL